MNVAVTFLAAFIVTMLGVTLVHELPHPVKVEPGLATAVRGDHSATLVAFVAVRAASDARRRAGHRAVAASIFGDRQGEGWKRRQETLHLRFNFRGRVAERVIAHGAGDKTGAAQAEQIAEDEHAVGQRVDLAIAVNVESRLDVGEVVADQRRRIARCAGPHGAAGQRGASSSEHVAKDQQPVGQRVIGEVAVDIERGLAQGQGCKRGHRGRVAVDRETARAGARARAQPAGELVAAGRRRGEDNGRAVGDRVVAGRGAVDGAGAAGNGAGSAPGPGHRERAGQRGVRDENAGNQREHAGMARLGDDHSSILLAHEQRPVAWH
ncbi:MAG: hypothetical protein IPI73_29145 [Betaproteobacteria bacterium]|nr:hypothetical protein [Betaproteobacteria bacterium]